MKNTSANFAQFKEILGGSITEMCFIEMDVKEDRVLCRTGEKGFYFSRQYYVLLKMLLGTLVANPRLS